MRNKPRHKKINSCHSAFILFLWLGVLHCCNSYSQLFTFAQLQGSPMNTTGWNLTGNAHVGNIKSNDNSELILCTLGTGQTGGAFYSQPVDLAKCNQWKAEFDFRIYDGTAADGLAFCFLNTPPDNFVNGQGIGIPSSANGLKVVFDTYNNCSGDQTTDVPRIEIRWGTGYNECSPMPTINNMSFLRSDKYSHAVITYNAGNISVAVDNVVYLTGFQEIGLKGYLGFTAGTGGNFDNHSIKNVTLYTNVPALSAGADLSVCAGQTAQIGLPDNSLYSYQWTPSEGLSSTTGAQPFVNTDNATNDDITRLYAVTTTLTDGSGCSATDTVMVTVKTLIPPAVSIRSSAPRICSSDAPPLFTATATAAGSSPLYEWMVNGQVSGTSTDTFSTPSLSDGDVVMCRLTNAGSCAADNTALSNAISLPVYLSPAVDAGMPVTLNYGSTTQLSAIITGNIESISWVPATGLSNPGIVSPVVRARRTTLYTITVKTPGGCTASDTVRIKVISKDVVLPPAFRPNGDGENDIFKPLVLGSTIAYSFSVYNRWGQLVYQSNTPDEGWDGNVKGNQQPAGTYTWIFSCVLDTNVPVKKKGTVVLIR